MDKWLIYSVIIAKARSKIKCFLVFFNFLPHYRKNIPAKGGFWLIYILKCRIFECM